MILDPMTDALVAIRSIQFAATTALLGAAFFRAFVDVCPRPPSDSFDLLDDRMGRIFIWAATLSLISAIAWLLIEAALMGGVWSDAFNLDVVATVALQTEFGRLWLVRLALALAALIASCLLQRARHRTNAAAILALLSTLLVASLAGTGHAVAMNGVSRAVAVAAQAVHLVAASVWIGGLLPLGLVLRRAKRGDDPIWLAAAQRIVPRFSQAALPAVILLGVSGLIASWPLAGGFRGLVMTAYGNVLLAKLALFGAMIGLAAVNRNCWSARLKAVGTDASTGQVSLSALMRNVALEQILAIGVLVTVGLLGILPPGAEVERQTMAESPGAPAADNAHPVRLTSTVGPRSDPRDAMWSGCDSHVAVGARS